MQDEKYKWDIFISYSGSNRSWVQDHLVEPLKGCRTEDGRVPKVFFDRESISAGENWQGALIEGIDRSRVVLAVCGQGYFSSNACKIEFGLAYFRDPFGARVRTIPMLIEPDLMAQVPENFRQTQWLRAYEEGWFDKLVQTLGYRMSAHVHTLRFQNSPLEAILGETLAPITVVRELNGAVVLEDDTVTLIAEHGALLGSTSVRSQNGMAVFSDVLLEGHSGATRLVAAADGCVAGFSSPFQVKPQRVIPAQKAQPPAIPPGRPFFFGSQEALAVFMSGSVCAYTLSEEQLLQAPLPFRVRLVKECAGGLATCGWGGEVLWIGSDGSQRTWNMPAAKGFSVPGDIAAGGRNESQFFLGMWSGEVYRLEADGVVSREFIHRAGIQALAVHEEKFLVADLEGFFCFYRNGSCEKRVRIERPVRLLKLFPDSLVIVTERHLSQFSFETSELYQLALQISVDSALDGGESVVVTGSDGKGILFDRTLNLHVFHGLPGARPAAVSRSGNYFVLRNPDGTHNLLHNRRIVFKHSGALGVSGSGSCFAVGQENGLRVVPAAAFSQMIERGTDA